jgi:hypothetical protein
MSKEQAMMVRAMIGENVGMLRTGWWWMLLETTDKFVVGNDDVRRAAARRYVRHCTLEQIDNKPRLFVDSKTVTSAHRLSGGHYRCQRRMSSVSRSWPKFRQRPNDLQERSFFATGVYVRWNSGDLHNTISVCADAKSHGLQLLTVLVDQGNMIRRHRGCDRKHQGWSCGHRSVGCQIPFVQNSLVRCLLIDHDQSFLSGCHDPCTIGLQNITTSGRGSIQIAGN